jgi:ATP-binding cassette, subfamily B, bacterial
VTVTAAETAADLDVVRSQTAVRAAGGALAGLAGLGVYAALGDLRRSDPDGREVVAAARAVGADAMIRSLPRGYDTLLNRTFVGGQELSGGQWQLLAAARAVFRDAPLLICDEPTAALDARAEHALFERIRRHADGRTVLLITHRLASVRYADRIYVLDHGKVVEQGTHDQLMTHGGIYADLYGLQARAYTVVHDRKESPTQV